MLCADAVIEALKDHQVDTVFGYPGANIAPLYQALSQSDIRHILCGNEQFAGMEAAGYTAVSGKTGVCFATSGPGAVNMLSGIANAWADSVPLIVITGQVARDKIGTDAFQEADITGAAAPFCKYSFLVTDPSLIKRYLDEAFYLAETGRKGPVLLDIPLDIQKSETAQFEKKRSLPGYQPIPALDKDRIEEAAFRINQAARPLLLLGGGVRAARVSGITARLINKGIPAVYTMNGRSTVPAGSLVLGMAGIYGARRANEALNSCDLLVLLGSRATERTLQSTRVPAIHIDIDQAELSKNLPAFTIAADLAEALPLLEERVSPRQPWITRIEEEPLHLYQQFSRYVSKHFDGALTADVGQNLIWTLSGADENRRIITSSGLGSMGFAVPAAIGAAATGLSAFAFCGDGGLGMSLSELSVIRAEGLDIKIAVADNGGLGMIYELQKDCYQGNHFAVTLAGRPNLETLADAYGFGCVSLSREDDMERCYEKAIAHHGGCFIRIKCRLDDTAYRR